MDEVSISEFKARCLAILEKVRRTGRGVLITRRGEPVAEVVPPQPHRQAQDWLGAGASTGCITGDVVSPLGSEAWEVLER
jgi:prevent-host-death family protein